MEYRKRVNKMERINIKCPICRQKLTQLNDITEGFLYNFHFEFWYYKCKIQIHISTDELENLKEA